MQGCETDHLFNVNIETPRYDQKTYLGRVKHFFLITNPLNVFVFPSTLERAKEIVTKHRKKERLPRCLTENELWQAKILYDSAYHPDTGEKMFILGRMSFQVPGNTILNAGMLTFYRNNRSVIFWQWMNQSFNAIVNYTNRSGNIAISNRQLFISYIAATASAVFTAISLNNLAKNAPNIIGRLVPLGAVAETSLINIPIMRYKEITVGTPIYDENNRKIGDSKIAARIGIVEVIFSRVFMAIPAMGVAPIVVSRLDRNGFFRRYPKSQFSIQLGVVAACLTFATPMACALFKQSAEIEVSYLEEELQETVRKNYVDKVPEKLFYNKGL